MTEYEERVRVPLGKSSYNTIPATQRCVKGFWGKKMVGFSKYNQG